MRNRLLRLQSKLQSTIKGLRKPPWRLCPKHQTNLMFVGAVILVSQTTLLICLDSKQRVRIYAIFWHNLAGLKFCDSDGFPRRICRTCYKRLKQFSEFKTLCLNSRSNQERELRLKRGEKVSESSSVALQREAKRGKGDDQVERSKPSPMKSLQFALIYPKEKLNEVAQPERVSDLGKKR